MAQIPLVKAEQLDQHNLKEWHKKLLRTNREKAIRKMKTELPQGVHLKEYLEMLDAEIQKENEHQGYLC